MKKLFFLLPFLIFISCSPEIIQPVQPAQDTEVSHTAEARQRTYTIDAGQHFSGIHINPFFGKNWLNFSASFDVSCLYELGNNNDFDINKLHGLTFGSNDKNSFRIGWNCQSHNGMLQLHYYIHDRGVMRYGYLFDVAPGQWFSFSINFDRSGIYTYPDGSTTIGVIHIYSESQGYSQDVPFNFSGVSKNGYYKYFYFGGDEVAPHWMKVTMDN